MIKARLGNDMTDCIGLVYTETETKLSGPIKPGVVCDKNQTRQRRDKSIGLVYDKIKTKMLRPI